LNYAFQAIVVQLFHVRKYNMTMRSKIFPAIIILLLMAVAGCDRPMILKTDSITKQEGVMIAGTYHGHWKPRFTSGISVKIDENDVVEIPWAEGRFLELNPGSHSFEIWYGWFARRASVAKGCFKLNQGQVLYLEYNPQGTSEGKVDLLDLNSRSQINYNKKCL